MSSEDFVLPQTLGDFYAGGNANFGPRPTKTAETGFYRVQVLKSERGPARWHEGDIAENLRLEILDGDGKSVTDVWQLKYEVPYPFSNPSVSNHLPDKGNFTKCARMCRALYPDQFAELPSGPSADGSWTEYQTIKDSLIPSVSAFWLEVYMNERDLVNESFIVKVVRDGRWANVKGVYPTTPEGEQLTTENIGVETETSS